MTGRLPTLAGNDANKPKSLKFKPKVVQRKSKEERDEALKTIELEKNKLQEQLDKKKRREDFFKQQQQQKLSGNRVPKYLQNTTLVSSGPLATGTFSGTFRPGASNNRQTFSSHSGSSGSGISSLIKNEHTELSIAKHGADSDDDNDREKFSNEGEVKINMGKEYKPEDDNIKSDEEDEANGEDSEDQSEAVAKFELDHLFPVRPIKIKHEDLTSNVIKEEVKQNFSVPGTKENTPDLLSENEEPTPEKMHLDELFYRNIPDNNHQQIELEKGTICKDYLKINEKIQNKKTSKLLQKNLFLYQLPEKLPFENENNLEDPLRGEIGQLRIHKSGKVTIKFSNGAIFDVFKSAETSFLQEVVNINDPRKISKQDTNKNIVQVKKEKKDNEIGLSEDDENDDIGTVQHLGTIAAKYVTVPRL